MSVSIFFPCYNDGRTIAGLVSGAAAAAREIGEDFEIIVVDDGSEDDSAEVLARLSASVPELRTVRHEKNRGYGGALRSGFESARHEWVFYTDGDAQYDPRELAVLFKDCGPGTDVVNGWKISRGDAWYRAAVGILYNRLVRAAFRLPLRDTQCDFRLIRRSILKNIVLETDSGAVCVELVKKLQAAGAVFREVPVHHFQRPHGVSQFFRPLRVLKTCADLPGLWWSLMVLGRGRPPHCLR